VGLFAGLALFYFWLLGHWFARWVVAAMLFVPIYMLGTVVNGGGPGKQTTSVYVFALGHAVFGRRPLMGVDRLARTACLVILIALALSPNVGNAACRCTYVDGMQQQLCDSSIDLPAMCIGGIAPLPPASIAPLPSLALPPLGTSSCRQAQVWNGQSYQWQTVCQ